jgi:hypothetical protein
MIATRMRGMRNLNEGPRLFGSTLSEIKRGYDVARARIGGRVRLRGATKTGEFLSSILVHFLDLTEAQQVAVVEHGMRRLEAMMEGADEGGDWRRPEPAAPPGAGKGGKSGISLEATSEPPPRRRRRGDKDGS